MRSERSNLLLYLLKIWIVKARCFNINFQYATGISEVSIGNRIFPCIQLGKHTRLSITCASKLMGRDPVEWYKAIVSPAGDTRTAYSFLYVREEERRSVSGAHNTDTITNTQVELLKPTVSSFKLGKLHRLVDDRCYLRTRRAAFSPRKPLTFTSGEGLDAGPTKEGPINCIAAIKCRPPTFGKPERVEWPKITDFCLTLCFFHPHSLGGIHYGNQVIKGLHSYLNERLCVRLGRVTRGLMPLT